MVFYTCPKGQHKSLVISIETDRTKELVRGPAYPKGNVSHGYPGEVIVRATSSHRKCATANDKQKLNRR